MDTPKTRMIRRMDSRGSQLDLHVMYKEEPAEGDVPPVQSVAHLLFCDATRLITSRERFVEGAGRTTMSSNGLIPRSIPAEDEDSKRTSTSLGPMIKEVNRCRSGALETDGPVRFRYKPQHIASPGQLSPDTLSMILCQSAGQLPPRGLKVSCVCQGLSK